MDVDFSIEGALIATSGADGTSRLWRNPDRPTSAGPAALIVVVGGVVEDAARPDDRVPVGDERVRLLNEPEAARARRWEV